MKNIYLAGCFMALLAPLGCTSNLPADAEQGERINLEFDMYAADVQPQTKAIGASIALTPMVEGTRFNVYAYSGNTPISNAPYIVETTAEGKNKATGNLSLYRGNYDLHMISSNSSVSDNLPTVNNAGKVEVSNGTDFMYNTLKNITVQPESDGTSSMTVPLTSPFIRLGSRIDLSVKASPNSPVAVKNLSVNSITISGLSDNLYYTPGQEDWDTNMNNDYSNNLEVKSFTTEVDMTAKPATKLVGDPIVVLPVDGSRPLVFDIDLSITYNPTTDTEQTESFQYQVTTDKALQKGMAYSFEFTLTFFGNLTPGDITLSAFGYSQEIDQPTDEVGDN